MLLPRRPGEAHFFHIPARTQKSASDKHTGLNSVNSLLLSTLIPLSFPSHLFFFLLAAFLSLTFERQKHSLQPSAVQPKDFSPSESCTTSVSRSEISRWRAPRCPERFAEQCERFLDASLAICPPKRGTSMKNIESVPQRWDRWWGGTGNSAPVM